MLEYIKDNKKNIFIIVIFLFIISTLSILISLLSKNNNQVLVSTYVSSLKKNDLQEITDCNLDEVLEYSKIPYFHIKNDFYNKMNDEIMYQFLLRACYQNGVVTYQSSINDNILSLALNISYESVNELTYVEYKTYNIDIKNNQLIDNQTILSKYNKTLDDATNLVMNRFLGFYEYETQNNYLEPGTTFNDYLEILDYEPLTIDTIKLFVDKNNKLWFYKEYNLSEAMMKYEDYPIFSIKFEL